MDGLLLLDKPAGWTSHDVVARVRGILREDRIGHLGTLDPLATGVLPLVLGAATRLVEFVSYEKEYLATCLLGRSTDSLDVTGKTLSEAPVDLPEGRVRGTPADLRNITEQVPPMVSAVKKDGRKLYELAREGVLVKREPRPVRILELEVIRVALPRVDFRVVCSAGTYVRVLCQDLGERLGTGGCLEALQRTRVGPFRLQEAWSLEKLQAAAGSGPVPLSPSQRLVEDLSPLPVDEAQALALAQGRSLEIPLPGPGPFRVLLPNGRLGAIGRRSPEGRLEPWKVFPEGGLE